MSRSTRLIIIIAVIVIGGGFAFYVGIRYQGETVNENSNTEATTAVDSTNVVYSNDQYDYQVTFPEGWTKQDDQGEYVSWMGPVAQGQEVVTELLQGMKIEIWTTDMIGVSLQDAVDAELDIYSSEDILERTDMTVDGQSAVKVKTFILGYTISTYILYNDTLYKFIGYVGDYSENAKYVAQYSSLLADFKFIQ